MVFLMPNEAYEIVPMLKSRVSQLFKLKQSDLLKDGFELERREESQTYKKVYSNILELELFFIKNQFKGYQWTFLKGGLKRLLQDTITLRKYLDNKVNEVYEYYNCHLPIYGNPRSFKSLIRSLNPNQILIL